MNLVHEGVLPPNEPDDRDERREEREMAQERETLADIVKELRRQSDSESKLATQLRKTGDDVDFASASFYAEDAKYLSEIADRIETAWKREARAIATEHAVLPAVCITKPSGNAAAMREALERLRTEIERFYNNEWIPYDAWQGCDDVTSHVLSAPARNCDVEYADRVEMYGAFKDWCKAKGHTMEPMLAYDAFDWLLAQAAEKGENDGSK